MTITILTTGLWVGEMLALTVGDIDFTRSVLHVGREVLPGVIGPIGDVRSHGQHAWRGARRWPTFESVGQHDHGSDR